MSGTSSKKDARKALRDAFTELQADVKDVNKASYILEMFNDKIVGLKNKLKKGKGTETIMGKYLKGLNITGVDKSPISKAVNEFLDHPATVFVKNNYMEQGGTITTDIKTVQKNVATKLGKCKRLTSADVLAAICHVTDKEEEYPVLRLLILGEMFTELGKANGFIKGNSAGVVQQNPNDKQENTEETVDDKDNHNKHLGTLATQAIRNLAATIGNEIRKLMTNTEWLLKEQGTKKDSETKPEKETKEETNVPTGNQEEMDQNPEDIQDDRVLALKRAREENAAEKYLGTKDNRPEVIEEKLKPRLQAAGKHKTRQMATENELKDFLKLSNCAGLLIKLRKASGTDKAFKAALDETVQLKNGTVTMRKILNKVADVVYQGNDLLQVAAKLPGDDKTINELLTVVELKLKRSHGKDDSRKATNLLLKDWITVIQVVIACAKPVEMDYTKDKTYDQMLADLPKKLNDINVQVLAGDNVTLEDKKLQTLTKVDIADGKALPALNPDYEKRLGSLGIGYNSDKNYKEIYKNICAFIGNAEKKTLAATKIVIQTSDNKTITEENWNKSKAFDDFVDKNNENISKIAIKYDNQTKLPPLNGEARDARLVLSAGQNAYAGFTVKDSWLKVPTKKACDDAVENLTVEDYLGTNKDLLTALKDDSGKNYVLAIKLADFVKSWVDEAKQKLGAELQEGKTYKNTVEGALPFNLGNGLKILAVLGDEGKGYELEQVNAFADFVSKNSSQDFCEVEGIKDAEIWGKLMTGGCAIIITPEGKKKLDVDQNGFKHVENVGAEKPTVEPTPAKPKEEDDKDRKDDADEDNFDGIPPLQNSLNIGNQPTQHNDVEAKGKTIKTKREQTGTQKDPSEQLKTLLYILEKYEKFLTKAVQITPENKQNQIEIGKLNVYYYPISAPDENAVDVKGLNHISHVIGKFTQGNEILAVDADKSNNFAQAMIAFLKGQTAIKVYPSNT